MQVDLDTCLGDGVNWSELVVVSPVPTLVLTCGQDEDGRRLGRIVFANGAARTALGPAAVWESAEPSIFQLVDHDGGRALRRMLGGQHKTMRPAQVPVVTQTMSLEKAVPFDVHIRPLTSGRFLAQFTSREGWAEVGRVVAEQQLFRSAILELTELAHSDTDDAAFFQRLIERAVEVVPGAQAGSIQLSIPGTRKFRFVAAVGFDLEGLQRHELEPVNFFRDTWDPSAQIVRHFDAEEVRSPEIAEWLDTVGRLSEIVVNVSAPVLSDGYPIAFLSLDNFEDAAAMTETSVEMTTVLGRLIGDLWERRLLEDQLWIERENYRELAMLDGLSGVANRRSLEAQLDRMLGDAGGRGFPTAVLFVDVDDFKNVNDELGHDVGDRLIRQVAVALQTAVRSGDVVGRWGGDEFLVLANRVDNEAEAIALADRISAQFEQTLDLGDGHSRKAQVSVGIGWTVDSQATSKGLMRAADAALYEAKQAGKGASRLRKAD